MKKENVTVMLNHQYTGRFEEVLTEEGCSKTILILEEQYSVIYN